jgi:hypothetical protein
VSDVQFQSADQRLVQLRVGEDGQDVLEENAGRGEVRELAQRGLELALQFSELVQRAGLLGGAGRCQ